MTLLSRLHARFLQAKIRILLRLRLTDPQKLRERQRRADMAHPERLAGASLLLRGVWVGYRLRRPQEPPQLHRR